MPAHKMAAATTYTITFQEAWQLPGGQAAFSQAEAMADVAAADLALAVPADSPLPPCLLQPPRCTVPSQQILRAQCQDIVEYGINGHSSLSVLSGHSQSQKQHQHVSFGDDPQSQPECNV